MKKYKELKKLFLILLSINILSYLTIGTYKTPHMIATSLGIFCLNILNNIKIQRKIKVLIAILIIGASVGIQMYLIGMNNDLYLYSIAMIFYSLEKKIFSKNDEIKAV
ncbi:hypothetical protein SAMN02745751_02977 [Dethiosulfatibacter aminovorans DSM 17477]|uniref:Uncharacterized protein n=1 Tax=Dethiosulfatibacter aminovorans DSM 17477 TaxID=1121476 RepID=A0A1M6KTJ3_9FIRM|nr:hypothetical protein [Dethiosulfatibacter aminovorans]SHJ62226.1 hypothetical protein SAMN02745751_02977 [Dethiosulfatibacter aminovorans DSM 17477]